MIRTRSATTAVVLGLVSLLVAMWGLRSGPVQAEPTDAAWTDGEYVHTAMATRDTWCDTGLYRTSARGQFFTGALLDRSTDATASLVPLEVRNPGSGSVPFPATATALGDHAYANPVAVTALRTAAVDLGAPLTIPLADGAAAGVLSQYARATSTGVSAGAAGAVSDSGVVSAGTRTPGSGLPEVASVDVRTLAGSTLLAGGLGSGAAADLTDIRLRIGAVGSSIVQDGCLSAGTVTRDYGIAHLRLEERSTALAAVSTGTNSAAATLQSALSAGGSVVTGLRNATLGVLTGTGGLLTLVGVGTPTATLTTSANLPQAVSALTGRTLGAGTAVTLDLPTGTAVVDLAALTDPTTGLNDRPPNSEVLTPGPLGSAVSSVGTLLTGQRTAVLAAARSALDSASATLVVTVPLTLLNSAVSLGTLQITASGTLATLAAGTGTVTWSGLNSCGVTTAAVCSAVNTLMPTLVPLIRTALAASLNSTLYGVSGAEAAFIGTVTSAVDTATSLVVTGIDALPNVLSVHVNAQPDQPGARTPAVPLAPGELAVSAIRVDLVPVTRVGWLAFATSSSGPTGYSPVTGT